MSATTSPARTTVLIDRVSSQATEGVEAFDVAAVNRQASRRLYKAREPIYPKLVSGPFRRFKWAFLVFALGVYYGVPWIRWPRGSEEASQAVLVDFPGRRFYFFFIELWPQEVYFITGLLVMAALALFLVTSLFGRVWCGYACPQTIWTDLFIAVERLIEGDRNARIKLARQPLTFSKLTKKAAKHALWLFIAFATGGAWILYFHDAPSLARDYFVGQAPATAYIFSGLLTFTTYVLAGTMREQVCIYMCPWPRIQGALTDRETFEITYRRDRGEPRGPHKKDETWEGRGDCVDCSACVAACPMGIDIRDGDQLECINCALCIDACDGIMERVGRPKGLIAYDTQLNVERRLQGLPSRLRLVRPRTAFYAAALAIVSTLMLYGLATRSTLDLNVLRDRNPNFVVLSDGSVRNGYTVKIANKANVAREFAITIAGPEALSYTVLGEPDDERPPVVAAPGDSVQTFRVFATLPADAIDAGSVTATLTVTEVGGRGASASNAISFETGASP
jgi:cytochrome c oxidase accessory protein FixG